MNKPKLKNIILVGGSPCAGKSTMSEYLANKFGYKVIKVDDYMGAHINESDEYLHPILYKWKTNPWYNLFSQEVEVQFIEEIEFYYEEWEMLKRDLYNDVTEDGTIIEGCALLPSKVKDLFDTDKIIYMVPTEEFQKEKYALRSWAHQILKDAEDPKKAFNNWMKRDIKYAKYISKEAEKFNYPVIEIDGSESIERLANKVIKMFNLSK